MSVNEIKDGIASLSPVEQNEVSAFLFQLRRSTDSEYQAVINARLADRDASHWLTPEEFEKRLDQR